jgi:hypothetical protein
MKTATVIKRIEKSLNITLEKSGTANIKYTGIFKKQSISFYDQDGEVISIATGKARTNNMENWMEDLGSKEYHRTIKSAIDWIKWIDNR